MTLELSWVGNVNIANNMTFYNASTYEAACANQLYLIKEAIKSTNMWTVVSSSNGVSVSNSDLWTSGSPSVIKYQKSSNPVHSWILFRSTGYAKTYFLIDYTTAPLDTNLINNVVSPSTLTNTFFPNRASFSYNAEGPTTPTAGTTSTAPNFEQSSITLCFYDDVKNNNPATSTTHKVNITYTPSDRGFVISEAQTNKNKLSFVVGIIPLQNFTTNNLSSNYKYTMLGFDTYEGLSWSGYPDNMNSSNSKSNPASSVTSKGVTYSGSDYLYTGNGITHGASDLYCLAPVYINRFTYSPTNVFKTAQAASDGSYTEVPILVYSVFNTPSYLGRFSDITWTETAIPEGSVTPPRITSNTIYEKIKISNIWIPWASAQAPML